MKTLKKIDVGSAALYGAVLVAAWTLVYGIFYWILGWIFGAQAWFIDMDIVNWTGYTFGTFLGIIWRMLVNALGGALAGLVVALVYNIVAGITGGLKFDLE